MSSEKFRLAITPQLGVNDKRAVIVDWYVSDGDEVKRGQPICCLETSKATIDVEAEYDGVFKILISTKESVDISQPLGIFFVDLEAYYENSEALSNHFAPKKVADRPRATAKAVRLAKELGVDISSINVTGIIREKDVKDFSQSNRVSPSKILTINLHPSLKNVAIYGSGQGGYTVLENLVLGNRYHVACYIDDDALKVGEKDGLPVLHSGALEVDERLSGISIALGVSDSSARHRILARCQALGVELINVIHPLAWIAPSVKMGVGNHIKAGAVIETRSVICDACIIDNNTTIPHDNLIESFSHLAPGVILGSNISVGEYSIIGIGSSIATGVTIGENCIVSVGSAVTKNIPNNSVVEGVPARVVGQRLSDK